MCPSWPYAIVINMTLPYVILKQMMAFPSSPVPLLDLCCEATKLQLYLGLDLSLLKASEYPKRSKVDQIFPRPLHVTAKSPQAQGSILSSFPNFPFHWKCGYLNRSDFSKERKPSFEPVQILFEMNECASSLNDSLFSSMASSLWTFYIAHDDLWHWHHYETHYFIKGLKRECLGSVMLDKTQD